MPGWIYEAIGWTISGLLILFVVWWKCFKGRKR